MPCPLNADLEGAFSMVGNSFLQAHRQRAGVSPVIRLKTVEKCACVQKPTANAISASGVSVFDNNDFACSMR
jgi:hypothetical protein